MFFKKLKVELSYDSKITTLCINPREMKSGSHRDTCTPTVTAASCTLVKIWKQPKYLAIDEWIKQIYNRILFILTREGNFAICNNIGGPRGHYAM